MTGAGAPPVIDLNADLGESFGTWRLGDDEALLTLITSANVACGFHAGDPLTLQRIAVEPMMPEYYFQESLAGVHK